MGRKREYFRKQLIYGLQHKNVVDFYLCCWQRNRSCLPLLCVRTLIFFGCLAILLASLILSGRSESNFLAFWPVFLTHWGVALITVVSGLSVIVSLRVRLVGFIDAEFGLPWYIKLYWAVHNSVVPIAFMITVFYYAFLYNSLAVEENQIEFTVSPALDVFVHAINSVLMFLLVITSRVPTYLLQVWQPILLGITYLVFSIIYYYSGGRGPSGVTWIYPMLDWANPGPTVVMVVLTVFLVVILHVFVVIIVELRNYIIKRYSNSESVDLI